MKTDKKFISSSLHWLLKDGYTKLLLHSLLIFGSFFLIVPFIWMISMSLSPIEKAFVYPPQLIPNPITIISYIDAMSLYPFGLYLFNSLFVSSIVTVAQLFTSVLAANALARLRFPGRNLIFLLILSTMMIPEHVTLIPAFQIIIKVGWLNTYYALIIPFASRAFSIFLLRQFFLTIPRELEDAARIDGCGRLRTLWHVILPASIPALSALTIFVFVDRWNAFLWPLIVADEERMRVVQVGLSRFFGQYGLLGSQWPILMAATVISAMPIVILFIIFQRRFIQGITLTGLKY